MIDLVLGEKRNLLGVDDLIKQFDDSDLHGTLYVGYPIIASVEQPIFVDALLTTVEHGVVVFDLQPMPPVGSDPSELIERHDDLFTAIEQKLKEVRALRERRSLAIEVNVVTLVPSLDGISKPSETIIASPESVVTEIFKFPAITEEQLRLVNASVQRITTIKPIRKRDAVRSVSSKGAVIKKIEAEIANLDRWQKTAAVESPDGPQRIRGLAGSGKTVVLALKAAYLHVRNPDWNIAITFFSRALYQQFIDLIQRFTFEHKKDAPDWDRLHIRHAWGSKQNPGMYSEIAARSGVAPMNLAEARQRYSYEHVFDGICRELVGQISELEPRYDAVLIDEAQDFPRSFFELCWLDCKDPKRVIYAYDELQNLGSYSMAPPSELFGKTESGAPRVRQLQNVKGKPREDIILRVCYRNTPWTLTVAHALGFGIYRKEKQLAQFFDDATLWQSIGYEIVTGQITEGSHVRMRRSKESRPDYFEQLLDPSDCVRCEVFEDEEEQARRVAEEIKNNLTTDELELEDILIILADPITAKQKARIVMEALDRVGIPSHLAGVTSDVDSLFDASSVAISGIYRAKGNEAPMVYLLDSQYGVSGFELIKRRNVLFTAITRSRAWVRLYGHGKEMDVLKKEIDQVVREDYQLAFNVPTADELERIRRIHRDRTPDERAQIEKATRGVEKIIKLIEEGEITFASLPGEIQDGIRRITGDK